MWNSKGVGRKISGHCKKSARKWGVSGLVKIRGKSGRINYKIGKMIVEIQKWVK